MSKRIHITFQGKENSKTFELNNILDKIFINEDLSPRELEFLEKFEFIDEEDLKDYSFLSLLDLFYLLSKIKKPIICDIKDREGKINQQIISLDYDYEECKLTLGFKHGIYTLSDNKFYKLTYEFKHDNYSLDIEGEYIEKVNINDED
jgi:hypothetical protein